MLLPFLLIIFILSLAKGNAGTLGSQHFSHFCSSQTLQKRWDSRFVVTTMPQPTTSVLVSSGMSALWMPSTWSLMSSCCLSPSQFCSLVSYSMELCHPTNTQACVYTQSCLHGFGGTIGCFVFMNSEKRRGRMASPRGCEANLLKCGNFRYKSEVIRMKRCMRTRKIRSKFAVQLLSAEVFFRFEIGNLQPLLLLDIRRLWAVGVNFLEVTWITENIQNVHIGSNARTGVGNI